MASRVWPLREKLVAPVARATSVQFWPLLSEMLTFCPLPAAWLRVPLIFCVAVLVMKSLVEEPVSSSRVTCEIVGGALLSTTMVLLLTSDRLPATSLAYNT